MVSQVWRVNTSSCTPHHHKYRVWQNYLTHLQVWQKWNRIKNKIHVFFLFLKSTYNAILFQLVPLVTFCFILFSVANMNWMGEHCAFIVETFIKNNKSRAFCEHFRLGRHDPAPTRNMIVLWVNKFRASGSAQTKIKWPISHRQNSGKCGSGLHDILDGNMLLLLGFQTEVCKGFFTRRYSLVIWSDCMVTLVRSPYHLIWTHVIYFCGDTWNQGYTLIALNLLNNSKMDNFQECLWWCVDSNSTHLTDLISKANWNKMALYVHFKNKNTFFHSLFYFAFITPTNMSDHFAAPIHSTSKICIDLVKIRLIYLIGESHSLKN